MIWHLCQRSIAGFVLFPMFFNSAAMALDVWVIPSEPITEDKMERQIRALPEELLQHEVHPFTEYLLTHGLSSEERAELGLKIMDGEAALKTRDLPLAIKNFEGVLSLLREKPLVQGLHKMFFLALIKLAESYEGQGDLEKAKRYWHRAFVFDPRAKLSTEIYSKSAIQKWVELVSAKRKEKTVLLKVKAPEGSTVLLDGKSDLLVYPGPHQWAVLVPGSTWQVAQVDVKKSGVYVFKPEPIVSGSCEAPQIKKSIQFPERSRILVNFENEKCQRVYDGSTWYDLQGKQVAESSLSGETPWSHGGLTSPMEAKKNGGLLKSPWFWIGLGAVAGITYTVIKNNEQTGPPVPSTTHY